MITIFLRGEARHGMAKSLPFATVGPWLEVGSSC